MSKNDNTSNKRFVAFLDILGFKELVENNDAPYLAGIYKKALKIAYQKTIDPLSRLEALNEEESNVKSLIISDSIILWSEFDSFNGFVRLCIYVQAFIYGMLDEGLPLRGSIQYDEFIEFNADEISRAVINTPIIIGTAITKAYTQELNQDWLGCTISSDSIDRFNKLHTTNAMTLNDLIKHSLIIEYHTPYKKGEIIKEHAINWPKATSNKPTDEKIIESFKNHSKNYNKWEIERKVKNTIDFVNYSWSIETLFKNTPTKTYK